MSDKFNMQDPEALEKHLLEHNARGFAMGVPMAKITSADGTVRYVY